MGNGAERLKMSLQSGLNDTVVKSELFLNDAERKTGTIEFLDINSLVEFKDHPFKVTDDFKMEELASSISEYGIMNPIIVFKNEDKEYEVISGHRRLFAAKKNEMEKVPCLVKKIDRDEATIIMVESNVQNRENLSIGEKAKAYSQMYEAIKRTQGHYKDSIYQGQRTSEVVAKKFNESASNIKRLISLTKLIPELFTLVDEQKMAVTPASEISSISSDYQRVIYSFYESDNVLPSLSQAQEFKKLYREGELTESYIYEKLMELKPNQKNDKVSLKIDKTVFDKYFKGADKNQMANKIIKALDFYEKNYEEHKLNDTPFLESHSSQGIKIIITGTIQTELY